MLVDKARSDGVDTQYQYIEDKPTGQLDKRILQLYLTMLILRDHVHLKQNMNQWQNSNSHVVSQLAGAALPATIGCIVPNQF